MNSRKETKLRILLITEQLKNQQHQLQIHRNYLKNALHKYSVHLGIFLGATFFAALMYRKSRQFLRILMNTFILTAPRLMVANRGKTNAISLILIQTLVTAALNIINSKKSLKLTPIRR